jgi:hypothetical protein
MANIIAMLASTLQAIRVVMTLIAFALYFIGLSFLDPSSSSQVLLSNLTTEEAEAPTASAPSTIAFFRSKGELLIASLAPITGRSVST